MQYVTKRAKSSENLTIFNQNGTIKEVFRKFRAKDVNITHNIGLENALIGFLMIPRHIRECKGSVLYHHKRAHLELYFPKKIHQKLEF